MDELLIRKAQKGDKDSFTKAVMEFKDQAYRITYCYLHDEEDSMDAVCDAVEKSLVNIKKLNDPKLFKTWFIRIVINECKMQMSKKKTVISLADSLSNSMSAATSDSLDKKQDYLLLDVMIYNRKPDSDMRGGLLEEGWL